jgi:hypothetical protein
MAARVHGEALARLDDEVERLVREQNAAVLCDAPALPLLAARRAGIPGFLMTNFTWADIYAPHARKMGRDAVEFVRNLREVYRAATAVFRVAPALRMAWMRRVYNMGMVVTRGKDRRGALRQLIGLKNNHKLVYLYVGRYGQNDLAWPRLGRLEQARIHFVTYPPLPTPAPSNLHAVPSPDWPGGDLIASCDAVFAKAGYGTVCEAMASRTPLVYPHRQGFAEHRMLDRCLREWGGGVAISAREFRSLGLGRALGRALSIEVGSPPFPIDGAVRIGGYVTAVCRGVKRLPSLGGTDGGMRLGLG